ncbi:hypothetical protein [Aneurinibacillus aneurinilyticus]|jgi:hypothetical protein|uniref:Uncharacterized protein n=2 Tax=Aneurinibacillus aneurinilyticus TaxID=1391 RepID=A0A848D1N4_ANEAE|nr:hypothetical protein [Aneurinibacillus aneurinilyticus]ERI07878.1 hypothetical protein HMPREF0083_04041 [Aneurinibacillus aneurinilyticus ATCC 12856]MED0672973.1 hypothetical protein [Aneurinibacillus aneurinilyticus]MED0705791.1 hypothetical protein [Aneurinibacillus aneurinilyticus]MED0722887.1 hypothetical protein [Aneurinibacillus aneurinilyticus]MED0743742.1 hypothetical protein [Aneurinibacillus aneurinilyticus]
MQVKCSNCDFEQFVKDHKFDKEYRADYERAILVLCGRNECDTSQIKIPNGCIKEMMWLGSWSIVREATLEEYRSIKRAKMIRDTGVEQCLKQ